MTKRPDSKKWAESVGHSEPILVSVDEIRMYAIGAFSRLLREVQQDPRVEATVISNGSDLLARPELHQLVQELNEPGIDDKGS